MRKKYLYHINEDEEKQATNAEASNDKTSAADSALLQQLVQLQTNIDNLTAQKQEKERQIAITIDVQIANLKKQMATLRMQLAKDGVNSIKNANESHYITYPYHYSSKLFESVPGNRTAEMFAVFKITQENIKNSISYLLTDTNCITYAKRLIAFINKNQDNWHYNIDNYWDNDTDDCVKFKLIELLTRGYGSYSNKEIYSFVNEFGKVLESNPMFSWLFNKK